MTAMFWRRTLLSVTIRTWLLYAHDWGTRDINKVRDALIGETESDNVKHTIVRSAFLSEFWRDEKVQALVSRWAKATGLEECSLRLASAGTSLAELAGLESRGELIGRDELTFAEDKGQEAEAAIAEFYAALEDFTSRLPKLNYSAGIGKEAKDFVIELGLPYPWLAMELIECSYLAIVGFALGHVFRVEGWYESKPLSEIIAPPATMAFQSREGVSVEDALNRLYDTFRGTMGKLLESVPQRGKLPDRTIPALERDARLFYRYKVKRESIRSIAIDEFSSSDRRKDVYDGIARAEKFLSLAQYTY